MDTFYCCQNLIKRIEEGRSQGWKDEGGQESGGKLHGGRGGGAEVKWKESEKKRMKERKRWDGVAQNRAGEGGQERELKG